MWRSLQIAVASVALLGCEADARPRVEPPVSRRATPHLVTIAMPPGAGQLRTGRVRPDGTAEQIPCATCHAGEESLAARNPGAAAVHGDVVVRHGQLACLACHDADDRDALHLADGRTLPFSETKTLCGQCHGPQTRDYEHGSHGGMSGYWDLERGPRVRNHCVVCHAPHAPAIPRVTPAPPPTDLPR